MKTILITGANGGIGLATVKLFLQNDYKVFAHYNSDKKNLDTINNKNLILIQADFQNTSEVAILFDKVLEYTSSLDVLVNNAGVYKPANTFDDLNINLFEDVLNVNLKSPFILSKIFIDKMKKFNTGRIINISSIGIKYGGAVNSMPYTISKAALEAMTLSFAKEGAKYNILVNALRVGVTNTDLHQEAQSKNMVQRIDMIPLKRMAEPEEISEYILFLASEKSNFTTGSIMTIAGGE